MPKPIAGHCQTLLCFGLATVLLAFPASAAESVGLMAPEGFEVSLFADDTLAHDIFCITTDANGQLVVAGPGYVKRLRDDNGDGQADRAELVSDMPKSGAHGMYFDGADLICNGDGGVRRLYDRDGDGKMDEASPLWIPARDVGHAANGIIRGPDGWYYMAAGNSVAFTKEHTSGPRSLVKEAVCGAMLRMSPDGSQCEIIADGFRNPYDLAFDAAGRLLTYDSDGERVFNLPWYTPTRIFDVAPGMRHGWVLRGWQRSWAQPESFSDNVERAVTIGRGSPTGLHVYRHHAFPARYRQGVFAVCWTFGRVYFCPLQERDASLFGKHEIFLQTTGETGFAPTDMTVGADGDLYVSIGGRGTRGSVFRVHYTGNVNYQAPSDPLLAVLTADEPLSSWSRARWVQTAEKLGAPAFVKAAADSTLPALARIRAVEILTELFGGLSVETARQLAAEKHDPAVLARAAWSLSRQEDSAVARQLLCELTIHGDSRVQRAAWEALAAVPGTLAAQQSRPDWLKGLYSWNRRVRAATRIAARAAGRESFAATMSDISYPLPVQARLGKLAVWGIDRQVDDSAAWQEKYFKTCQNALSDNDLLIRLEAIRLMQLGLGDVVLYTQGDDRIYCGYMGNATEKIAPQIRRETAQALARQFPFGDAEVDREAARLLAMLGEPDEQLLDRIAAKWTSESTQADDLHYLIVVGRIPGEFSPEIRRRLAAAFAGLHAKLAAQGDRPSDEWTPQLGELYARFVRRDPPLAPATVSAPGFGRIEHPLLARSMPAEPKTAATRKLLATAARLEEEEEGPAWTPDLVELVASLPAAEALPQLREHWHELRLQDSIALALTRLAQPEDRPLLIESLDSTQATVVAAAAETLTKIGGPPKIEELTAAVKALRRYVPVENQTEVRQSLARLIASSKGAPTTQAEDKETTPAEHYEPVFAWFGQTYPEAAATLTGLAGAGAAQWQTRLAGVKWEAGEATRGERVFQKKACYRCHAGADRYGPDLTGVAQRFNRTDLLTTIIEPNKDISPLYRTTQMVTRGGKIHTGMLVYESPELWLVQTTPDTTIRIPGEDLLLMRPGRTSFMPTGLLDGLADEELADLYAYLKTLRKE